MLIIDCAKTLLPSAMAAVLCFAMCKANVFTPLGHHIGGLLHALALIDPLGAIFWGTYNSWIAFAGGAALLPHQQSNEEAGENSFKEVKANFFRRTAAVFLSCFLSTLRRRCCLWLAIGSQAWSLVKVIHWDWYSFEDWFIVKILRTNSWFKVQP